MKNKNLDKRKKLRNEMISEVINEVENHSGFFSHFDTPIPEKEWLKHKVTEVLMAERWLK